MISASSVLDDRYELGEVLGSGGMAEVRLGHDRRLGRQVAVKLLRPDVAVHPGVRQRFAEEATAAARLTHPNAVVVYDTGDDDGEPYIVMELLSGPTLAAHLAAEKVAGRELTVDDVRHIGADVLAALGAAHALGIVHRDIKPGNVLLTDDGTAKVCDFGIAKSTEGLDLTLTGELLGTPAYMAPERLAGGPATPVSDLYSVGVVLFEVLAGVKPFAGDTAMAMAAAVVNGQPATLRALRPDLPDNLVAVIERAMAREPEARFDSAEAMADALVGTDDDPTITVVAPPAVDRTMAFPVLPVGLVDQHRRTARLVERHPVVRPTRTNVLAAIGAVLTLVFLIAIARGSASPRLDPFLTPEPEPADTTVLFPPPDEATTTTAPLDESPPPVADNPEEKSGRGGRGKAKDDDD